MKKHLLPLLWVLCIFVFQSKDLKATKKTGTQNPKLNSQQFTKHDKDTKAARATIIYVKHNASGANNGTSWADAYTDLQTAITNAVSGDHIWVVAGTYKPTATASRDIYFEIPNGVELYGGFAGTESDTSQRKDYGAGDANETILSGDIGTEGDNTDNSYHVVYIDDASTTIKLNGLTISDGYALDAPEDYNGGGIYISVNAGNSNQLIVSNCIISDNRAYTGGGVHQESIDNASNTITSYEYCKFINNIAYWGGGNTNWAKSGILTTNFNSCLFQDNSAKEYDGGAIFLWSLSAECNAYITNCTFSNNMVDAAGTPNNTGGGAIYASASTSGDPLTCELEITSSSFNNNSSTQNGGAIATKVGNVTLTTSISDCVFNNNSSEESGGCIYIKNSHQDANNTTTINRCKLQGNESGENGGAISTNIESGIFALTTSNCLISGNIQTDNTPSNLYGGGGGIHFKGGASSTLNILNTTISGNYATFSLQYGGGGGLNLTGNGITANINNSVIYGNFCSEAAYSDLQITFCQQTSTFTNCIVNMGDNALTGTNITYLDPRFTNPIDASNAPTTNGDYSLLAISPLINAGTTTDAPADDIDGNTRPLPAGTMPDIGAYEYSQMETTAPSGSGTSEEPYQVSSLANLAWMQYQLWDLINPKYYNLTTNIDASSSADWNDGYGFRAIGSNGYYYSSGNQNNTLFAGTFNGNSHSIDGLYINDPSGENNGLFGNCYAATVENLELKNVSISGGSYTGALMGVSEKCSIDECMASGAVSGTSYVGGLIGLAENHSSINKSSAQVDVTSSGQFTGILIGKNSQRSDITKCFATGDVSSSGSDYTGGFIGLNDEIASISNCFYKGSVNAANATSKVGGFVGNNTGGSHITKCYSVADVTNSGTEYGFCGLNEVNDGLVGSFWNIDIATNTDGVGGSATGEDVTGKTTSEMKEIGTYKDKSWNFDDIWAIDASTNEGYPYLRDMPATPSLTISWTGDKNTVWEQSANWDPEQIPTSDDNVIIPVVVGNPYPVISNEAASPAICNNLTIKANASLTIQTDKALTVNGILETELDRSDGSLVLQEDASLIAMGFINGSLQFQRTLSSGKYHYISSPIDYSSTASTASTFSNLNLGLQNDDQFYRWEENYLYNGSIGNWVDILNGEDGTNSLMGDEVFQKAKGYAISYNSSSETISLSGTPFDRSMSISMTKTENSTREGWNLLGNPFTAALAANNNASATNLVSVNTANLSAVKGGIYVWDEQANYEGNRNDYLTISNLETASYIAPGQAFMVCAATNEASFEIEKGMQQHAAATFYKSTDDIARFYLQVKGPEKDLNDILIGFVEGKTKGLDPSYDVAKVKGNPNIALYSYLIEDYNNQEFAHQALPAFKEDYAVQIGLDAWIEGKYTFSTKEMQNIPEHIEIELLDKESGIRTNMRDVAEYTFHISNPESLTDRFVLTFKAATGIAEGQNTDLFSAYSVGSKIYIQNPQALSSDVRIMDISGKILREFSLNTNCLEVFEPNLNTGIYLIQISNNKFMYNKQILLQ